MKNIRKLVVRFNNELSSSEVSLFRGAVNAAMEEKHSVLFHNHLESGLRYSYPLIQYKRINRKAAIVCIEDGVDVIGELFCADEKAIRIKEKTEPLIVESIKAERILVQIWHTTFDYRIRNWLPLNSKNYNEYKKMESLSEKLSLLERILIGNILSFLKGVGIHVDEKIICKITKLSEPKAVCYKNVKLMAFDAEFKTNVSIPHLLGIGKDASIGYGIVSEIKTDLHTDDSAR